jgi:hypothetical protein
MTGDHMRALGFEFESKWTGLHDRDVQANQVGKDVALCELAVTKSKELPDRVPVIEDVIHILDPR